MAKTSTSREINGKNKYIKGEKWQKQVHQRREMAKTSTSRERNGRNKDIKGEKWQY